MFVDDPGGQDIIAEKGGVILDFRDVNVLDDYRNVIALVLEDGIISPSEDQMVGDATAHRSNRRTTRCPCPGNFW